MGAISDHAKILHHACLSRSLRKLSMHAIEKPLHIDIPVKLERLRIAFSIASLAFEGDLPASIFHLQLITNDIHDWNAGSEVVGVFHTNAGHVALNDDA